MKILVIDGQGGGIGKNLIEQLKVNFPDSEITAIGTNSVATSNMLKAGADFAATGENSVIVACRETELIVGPIGIVMTDSMIGEITEKISSAVSRCSAPKILIPVSKCKAKIAGTKDCPFSKYISDAIKIINNEYINK